MWNCIIMEYQQPPRHLSVAAVVRTYRWYIAAMNTIITALKQMPHVTAKLSVRRLLSDELAWSILSAFAALGIEFSGPRAKAAESSYDLP